jgi:predicted phosphodiesterase
MGFRFDISHINLVGYLTNETGAQPPRVDRETLYAFLWSLAHNSCLISSTEGSPEDWVREVTEIASFMLDTFEEDADDLEIFSPIVSGRFLDPLRGCFTGYDFYALVLPEDDWKIEHGSLQFFKEAAISSGTRGLVLLPGQPYGEKGLSQYVDPFPALQVLAKYPISLPGVLFWSGIGGACALALQDAFRFLRHDLLDALAGGRKATDEVIARQASRQQTKRILHLSDLHIGLEEATLRRSYLKRHIRAVLPSVDRVAVTGDLFDTPRESLRAEFDEFRRDIEDSTNKPVLVVPGNHDIRIKGNALGRMGRQAEYVTDLEWSPFEVDEDMQACIYSFNSAESGNLARGRVSKRQRLSRAELYERTVAKKEHIEGYIKIALVHHHPVNYESKPTALYEKILAAIGGDARFISFEESDEFLDWCLGRDVSFVLHGHKHIPHLTTFQRERYGNELVIVGCGSSVGAEQKPMCYDIVSFDPNTKRWGVSFHHDEAGDGSGFKPQNVALDLRT